MADVIMPATEPSADGILPPTTGGERSVTPSPTPPLGGAPGSMTGGSNRADMGVDCERSQGRPVIMDSAQRTGQMCSQSQLDFVFPAVDGCQPPLVTVTGNVRRVLVDADENEVPIGDSAVIASDFILRLSSDASALYTIRAASECETSPSRLVINEVDYVNQGGDVRDFVELFNAGDSEASLENVRLEVFDAAGMKVQDQSLGSVALTIPPKARFVVGNAIRLASIGAVPSLQVEPFFLPNTGGAVRLLDGVDILDQVAFGQEVPGFALEDVIPLDPGDTRSVALSRIPDGFDSGDSRRDFKLVDQTVGRPNVVSRAFPIAPDDEDVSIGQGMIVGELRPTSVLLQTRLTASGPPDNLDYQGRPGVARFEVSQVGGDWSMSPWYSAVAENDFMIRHAVRGLSPGQRYRWRVRYGLDEDNTTVGDIGTFRTPSGHGDEYLTLVAVSCISIRKYMAADRNLDGFDTISTIDGMNPDAVFFTGDTVYYDQVDGPSAVDAPAMRVHWHQTLGLPVMKSLFKKTATYWQKDDHDFRFNDADRTPGAEPSTELGLKIFREQVPVALAQDPTWRTIRLNRLVQVWLLEGRDHRSANTDEDGPAKTLWGVEQKQWLKESLRASDATVKLVVTPTPIVGPDWGTKRDNHTNALGFQHEGREFLDWAQAQGMSGRNLFLISGDRHWRYISRHMSGLMEFGTGAVHSELAFVPPEFAGENTTDPEGRVERVYASSSRVGGFLKITINREGDEAVVQFEHFLYDGRLEHSYEARFTLP